jgi:hypothetical protein
MATVTPNFNWPVPTSTDLVKDGATAIEALGDSIDASLLDLKGGTTGQVLSKTTGTDMDFTWVTTDDANAIQNSIVDAKGDLIAATANDTPARLAVGSNGQTIIADSTASTGLSYSSNAPAGGLQSLGSANLTGAATVTFSGISNKSRLWLAIENISTVNTGVFVGIRLNAKTDSYGYAGIGVVGTAANPTFSNSASQIFLCQTSTTHTDTANSMVQLDGCFSAGMVTGTVGGVASGTSASAYQWNALFSLQAAQVTSVSVVSGSGNFDGGSITIYGA